MNWEIGIRKWENTRAFFRLPCAVHRGLIVVLFLILTSGIGWGVENNYADSGSLTASLDQTSVPVGGVVWLTLDYRLPAGGRLPEKPTVKGLDGLTVLKQVVEPHRIRVQLLVDQVGPWRSDPIRLDYLDSEGGPQVLTAEPVALQVESNLGEKPEEAQLRPIADIIAVRSMWRSFLLWGAALAAVILAGLGAYSGGTEKDGSPAMARSLPGGAPSAARRAIEQLETQGYFEKGMVKKYYFVFSEILRRYLESIRHFPAVEYTTEEIAQHIRAEPDRRVLPLLQRADLVKFADERPTPARKQEDIEAALAYIRETGPVPESSPVSGPRPEAQP